MSLKLIVGKLHETGKLLGSNFNDKKNLFIALQFSIIDYFGISLNDKRVVYCHEHSSTYDVSLVPKVFWWHGLRHFFLPFSEIQDPNYIALLNWEKTELNIHTRKEIVIRICTRICVISGIRLLEVASLHPDNFLLIRLEDLVKDKTQMLHKLCHELKIEFNDSLLQTSFLGKHGMEIIFSYSQREVVSEIPWSKNENELSFLRKSIFWNSSEKRNWNSWISILIQENFW